MQSIGICRGNFAPLAEQKHTTSEYVFSGISSLVHCVAGSANGCAVKSDRLAVLAGGFLALLSACSIPVDIGPIERPFQPQFPTGTDAIVGFPRERVDFGTTYGNSQLGKLVIGDTVSLFLLHDDRTGIPVLQLSDTVRVVSWRVATWRLVGGLSGSHYGEEGIATMQHRDASGRGLLSALKPGLVYLGAGGYGNDTDIPVYSCTRENCVPVAIVISE